MEQQKKEKKKVVMPYGLRNKLMAAVAMLLVSSIMMVSSTFAWFTLSTAPEIKGISTSVGANGNLEMALLTSGDTTADIADTFKDLTKITSAAGDSSKDLNERNLTWGNLVNLDYTAADKTGNYYGLDKIQLMPARLNRTTEGNLTAGSPLLTPKYGTDGRVGDVNGQTFSSAKYTADGFEYKDGSATYGVRAVGESATLTPQAKGLMNAKAAYTTHLNEARSTVQTSLKTNMQGLANAALALVDNSTAPLGTDEQTAIKNLLTDMNKALDSIDMAYGDVVRAMVAKQVAEAATYDAVMNVLSGKTYSQITKTGDGALAIPEGFTRDSLANTAVATAAATLATQKQVVDDALKSIKDNTANYSNMVKQLADTEHMNINGLSLQKPTDGDGEGTVWTKNTEGEGYVINKSALFTSFTTHGGITINMADGSGLFAYVAERVNTNYSASEYIGIKLGGFEIKKNDTSEGVLVTMKTTVTKFDKDANDADAANKSVTTEITALTAATATGVTDYITDTYGYIIDLAFRTNASGSHLKLATDGMQRIYNGDDASTNTETMGAGSTMTFTSVKDGDNKDVMSEAAIIKLMAAIRVVFFDPGDGTTGSGGRIYGFASLDNVQKSEAGVTGKLTLKNADFANGVMTLTDKGTTDTDKDKLMDLTQNTAARMSVLVYLDGDMVDNSMVANAEQSITGSLNLQFASSAPLKPMQNSALKNGTTTNP